MLNLYHLNVITNVTRLITSDIEACFFFSIKNIIKELLNVYIITDKINKIISQLY